MCSPLLCCFLGRSYKEVHKSCKNEQSEDQSDYVYGACEEEAELIYDECNSVSEYALIADSEPCPLSRVHLSLDSTDCSEARSAEEVEDEESEA